MRGKVVILWIVLFVLGVPAAVFFTVNAPNAPDDAYSGAQPGGTVRGVVLDAVGAPIANVLVEGIPAKWPEPGAKPTTLVGTGRSFVLETDRAMRVETTSDGTFSLQLEPHDGLYVLRASAAQFATRERCFSFLGEDRKPLAVAPPIEIVLAHAACLIVALAERDGSSDIEGHYTLEQRSSSFFDLRAPHAIAAGAFRAGRIQIDALPLVTAHLSITTRDGKQYESDVDLKPGEQTIGVKF